MTTPLQTLIKQLENRYYGDNTIPNVLYYLKQLENITEKNKTITTLKRCLFQMQEAAKYLLKETEKNHVMDSSEYFMDRDRVFKRNWFKPWVSLTEEEITNAFNIDEQYNEHIYAEIEKVLKRKNGF